MTFEADPYRVLGVPRGASVAEVKRAYRLLVKQFHPDSAGDRALPRFLAIQAAYESLVGSKDAGPARGRTRSSTGRPGSPRPGPARPAWEADPTRARATRDAYRRRASGTASAPGGGAGQGGPGRTASGPTGGPATGASGGSASWGSGRAGSSGTADNAGAAGHAGASAGAAPGRRDPRRSTRKATLGSTSYDDAAAQFESTWSGGTWYGASSGTYWTINPKEYADPRKHGPEYLARARRARRRPADGDGDPTAGDGPLGGDEREGADGAADASADADPLAGADAAEGSGADASATPGAPEAAFAARWARYAAATKAASAPPTADDGAGPTTDPARRTGSAQRSVPERLLVALLAWPPIGLAIAGGYGELTGCGRFAATCSAPADAFGLGTWVVQLALLAALIALPTVARHAAAGSLALLAAAIPSAVLLSAIGGARDPGNASNALVGLLVVAWLIGVGLAVSGRFDPLAA